MLLVLPINSLFIELKLNVCFLLDALNIQSYFAIRLVLQMANDWHECKSVTWKVNSSCLLQSNVNSSLSCTHYLVTCTHFSSRFIPAFIRSRVFCKHFSCSHSPLCTCLMGYRLKSYYFHTHTHSISFEILKSLIWCSRKFNREL